MRFFRCESGDWYYESVRSSLDLAWGLPNEATKTRTCLDPAEQCLRDQNGRIVIALQPEFCEYSPASEMLPAMLADGDVSEITAAEYAACLPRWYR